MYIFFEMKILPKQLLYTLLQHHKSAEDGDLMEYVFILWIWMKL